MFFTTKINTEVLKFLKDERIYHGTFLINKSLCHNKLVVSKLQQDEHGSSFRNFYFEPRYIELEGLRIVFSSA